VIRDCLLERGNWEETDEEEAFLRGAFIWKPVHLIDTVRTFTISYFDEFDNEIETLQSLWYIIILILFEEFQQSKALSNHWECTILDTQKHELQDILSLTQLQLHLLLKGTYRVKSTEIWKSEWQIFHLGDIALKKGFHTNIVLKISGFWSQIIWTKEEV